MHSIERKVAGSARLLKFTAARLHQKAIRAARNRTQTSYPAPESVVHVTPQYFDERSYIGGGERYATYLARAMADMVDTTLVSFGPKRDSFKMGRLNVEIYPVIRNIEYVWDPLNYSFLRELKSADVVHCHQYKITVTNLAIFQGAAWNKRIFVTDLGGAGNNYCDEYDVSSLVDGFLPISRFAERMLPGGSDGKAHIIFGGVDNSLLESSLDAEREQTALFVGRFLPHKGINYLIEGISKDTRLEVVGRPYMPEYFDLLRELAVDKSVTFRTDASDQDLKECYRRALVTILPSVYDDVYHTHNDMPELLGLVLLEGMASGTAAICTDVASMPEFVRHEVDGFVVPPNDPKALGARVDYLVANPDIAKRMGRSARERVAREFTWDSVAKRCLDAYRLEQPTVSLPQNSPIASRAAGALD